MLIHAYLPLGKQDKCFHLQTEKAASDQKSCRCSSKTLIHLNLPDTCCGKFPVTWTQHMQRFRDISQSWALPQHALPWINPGSHWSVHPPWAWKMGFLYKYLDWFEALVMAALILLAWPEASTLESAQEEFSWLSCAMSTVGYFHFIRLRLYCSYLLEVHPSVSELLTLPNTGCTSLNLEPLRKKIQKTCYVQELFLTEF